jgi:hypothetical protein
MKSVGTIILSLVTLVALLALSSFVMEFIMGGELAIYFICLLGLVVLKLLHQDKKLIKGVYYGLIAFLIIYALPLFAFYVLGWRDM